MKYRVCALCMLLSWLVAPVMAVIPAGYYSSVDGLTGDAICAALHQKIKSHTSLGYDNLYSMYQTSDMTPQGYIWDMYSTCNFANPGDKCGSYRKVCDCFNREHSVPASWFNDANPMYCDPFHVVPTDGFVNNQRSNYPLGECSGGTRLSGGSLCKLGSSTFSGYTSIGKVFEVDDEYKGDFARAYFYMVTCYRDKNFTQAGGGATMFTWSNSKAGLTNYTVALMLKWHRQDPVSDKEIRRNEAIYVRQGNRNPFIDYPCLAEYIWGQYKNEPLDMETLMASSDDNFDSSDRTGCNCQSDKPTLESPKNGVTIVVGSASVGESVYQDVEIRGKLLTQALTCTLSGTNANFFTLDKSSITATAANSGVNLRITYCPTTTGRHTATLTISSSEIKSARVLTLTGESKAELVSPVSGTSYMFVAEGIRDRSSQVVHVKGTNLSTGIYIGLDAAAQQAFSVSPTSLTAAEAMSGADVVVTYAPATIGTTTGKLIVNSLGNTDFPQPTLTLNGRCFFATESVTDITSSSATLHWVDAGVSSYLVDVFFLTREEEQEVVILDELAGNNATKVQYYDTSTKGYIRLGSSSKGGSITYAGVDLSKGGTITITAKAYNSTDESKMKVTVNGAAQSFALSTEDVDYTIEVNPGASSSSTIKIEAPAKNQRLYVKRVRVTTGGTKEVRTSLPGYPRQENYLFHNVSGLVADTEYSYTVTPSGFPASSVQTFTTGTISTDMESVSVYDESDGYKSIDGSGRIRLHHGVHTYSATGVQIR